MLSEISSVGGFYASLILVFKVSGIGVQSKPE